MTLPRIQSQEDKQIKDFTAEEIKQAFLSEVALEKPVEQALSVCESVFDLIDANEQDLPEHLVKTLWHLQQCFRVYMALMVSQSEKEALDSFGPGDMDHKDDTLSDLEPDIEGDPE